MSDQTRPSSSDLSTSQAKAVWRTYTSRRLLWVLAGALLLAYGLQWSVADQSPDVGRTRNAAPEVPLPAPSFSETLSTLKARADTLRYQSATLRGDLTAFRESVLAGGFQGLRSIVLYTHADAADFKVFAKLPNLQSLSLLQTKGLTADDLSQLANCDKLRHLKVLECDGYAAAEPIRWPANLEIASLNGPSSLPLRRLKELQKLPSLRVLDARLYPDHHPASDLPDEALQTLKTFPALSRLYLEEAATAYPDLIANTQRQLPWIRVRPAYYSDFRLKRAAGSLMFAAALLGLLVTQLSAQFVGPQAVVLPGYARAHCGAAGLLLLLGLLSQAVVLAVLGCSVWGIAGLLSATVIHTWLLCRLLRYADPAMPGFAQPALLFVQVMSMIPVLLLLEHWCPSDWDWFLRGHQPGLAILLTGAAVWCSRDLVRWLTGLHRLLETHGRGAVPLNALNLKAWQEWEIRRPELERGAAIPRDPVNDFLNDAAARLERALDATPSPVRRRRLLTVAEGINWGRAALLIMFVTIAGGLIVLVSQGQIDLRQGIPERVIIGTFGYLAAISFYFPFLLVFRRRDYLAMEQLRPASRATWIGDWFQLTAWRLALPMLASFAALGKSWSSGVLVPNSPLHGVAIVALLMALWGLVYGGGLWLVTYRWTPYALVAAVPLLILVIFALTVTTLKFSIEAWLTSVGSLWALVGVAFVLAGIACLGAWKRWQRWELAK